MMVMKRMGEEMKIGVGARTAAEIGMGTRAGMGADPGGHAGAGG